MKITPRLLKFLLNIYPPYMGTGVKVTKISDDWRESYISMSASWFNRNAMGTHFGGSLYSMIDPHCMLLLMKLLGDEYIVWDKSAEIDFIKSTKKKVNSIIKISDKDIDEIKANTSNGNKYFSVFPLEIIDDDGELIAKVIKTIYVKKKISQKVAA